MSGELYTVAACCSRFQFAPLGASEFWTTIDTKNRECAVARSCHHLDGLAAEGGHRSGVRGI